MSDQWRKRAETARRLAQEILNSEDRRRLLELADEYDRRAAELEQRQDTVSGTP